MKFLTYLALIGAVTSINLNKGHMSDPVCPSLGCDILKANNLKPDPEPKKPRMGNYSKDGTWTLPNVTATSNKTFELIVPDDALHTAQKKRADNAGQEVPVNLVFLPNGDVLTPEDQGLEIPINLVFMPTGQVLSADDFDDTQLAQSAIQKHQQVLAQSKDTATTEGSDVESLQEENARETELKKAEKDSEKNQKIYAEEQEQEEEARSRAEAEKSAAKELKKRTNFSDGLIHEEDGTRKFSEDKSLVRGVNNWVQTGSQSSHGHWVERKKPTKHHHNHHH